MTLSEFINTIEERGYDLQGKSRIPDDMMAGEVIAAPAVLIPTEPPIEEKCEFIENMLTEFGLYQFAALPARIDGAATIKNPPGVVRLQFIRKDNKRPVIEWNRAKLKRLKAAYAKACESGQDVFQFDGHDFVREFAKYLIEYLDGRLL